MSWPTVTVNTDRLVAELHTLAGFSMHPAPAVTRVLYTEPDLHARAYLTQLAEQAGLRVRVDGLGNWFARWDGNDPDAPAVGTGSHTDAIPHSGRYDGTVGVLGGLEALRALQASGYRPRRALEVLMFTSEEPTRFGLGCVGSRVLAGALSATDVAELRDSAGQRLDDVRRAAGFTADLEQVRLPSAYYAYFVELHIEQGPLLEQAGVPLGAVTAIAAPAALRVVLTGAGGHAGAVLMPTRHDALCAAAEVVLAVEAAAHATGSPDAVATTGLCQVYPGACNSVPSRVTLEIDVRDVRSAPRDQAVASIRQAIAQTCARRGVTAEVSVLNADPPATLAEPIITATEQAAQHLGLACQRMVSRAYHDSLFMARVCPTGMIFIPCRAGVSHRPDEYASPDALHAGVQALALTLARLAE